MSSKIFNVAEIFERLKDYYSIRTDTDLAKFFGINLSTLSAWKHRNTFDFEQIYTFCEENSINLQWVLTGDGEPREEITQNADLADVLSKIKHLDKEIVRNNEANKQDLRIELLREKLDTIEKLLKLL
ncbi:MAG: helix-turn-helix domain-containing protein [Candidatus Kapabacteria bacterium]|nr:helix-turn-helix domain-containing protein [Candidatus Kapabacteria bacterium]